MNLLHYARDRYLFGVYLTHLAIQQKPDFIRDSDHLYLE